jgi:hypothetical protein
MNTDLHAAFKRGFKFAAALTALACAAASCGPRHTTMSDPHCAFADPEVTTSIGICNLAAEYYVSHHEWPLTKAQLEEQHKQMLDAARVQMSADEAQELSGFLEHFTLLDLRKSGEDLVLHYRFKVEQRTVDQTVTLKPRSTADDILQAATAKGYD